MEQVDSVEFSMSDNFEDNENPKDNSQHLENPFENPKKPEYVEPISKNSFFASMNLSEDTQNVLKSLTAEVD